MNAREVPTPVLQAFALFGRFYRTWVIDESVIASWWALLSDVPPDQFLRAAIEHSRASTFPPTPAELRKLALRPEQEGLTAEDAWSEVIGEIRRVGWCGKPQWSTPQAERAAAALGSWRTLCSQTSNELAANRAHFFRLYSAFAGRAEREVACLEAEQITAGLLGGNKPREQRLQTMYGVKAEELDEPYGERDESIVRAHSPDEDNL